MGNTWTHEREEVHRTVIESVQINFCSFDEKFRGYRKKDRGCKLCFRPFKDLEMMNLAFTSKGNKLICKQCAEQAKEHGVKIYERNGEGKVNVIN